MPIHNISRDVIYTLFTEFLYGRNALNFALSCKYVHKIFADSIDKIMDRYASPKIEQRRATFTYISKTSYLPDGVTQHGQSTNIVNGKVIYLATYRCGVLHGAFYEDYSALQSRDLVQSGQYRMGKKCGKWAEMPTHTNKSLKSEYEYGSYLTGHYNMYYKRLKHIYKHPSFQHYNIHGELDGISRKWITNPNDGEYSLIIEENYVNGKRNGLYREWYSHSRISSKSDYVRQLHTECYYLDDALHGKYVEYWNDGRIRFEREYEHSIQVSKKLTF